MLIAAQLAAPAAALAETVIKTRHAASGSDLYAGGAFTGQAAQWNGVGWDVLGALDGDVHALAVSGGGIAKWNGVSWDVLGGGVSGGANAVYAIAAGDGGDVYIGGDFTGPATNVAKWNGSSWESLGRGLALGAVLALAFDSGNLYAGGDFLSPVDAVKRGLARWDGSAWHDVGDGVSGAPQTVRALAANGSELYVGGNFSGFTSTNVIRWNGIAWHDLEGGVSNVVNTLVVSDGRPYVGGLFVAASGVSANNVAFWDAPTTDLSLSRLPAWPRSPWAKPSPTR